jgi:hypothetical protein
MQYDPPYITVTQAAERLQISRTLAYELARRYLLTGGKEGLPVIRLGTRILRVVVAELYRLGHLTDGEHQWPGEAASGQR